MNLTNSLLMPKPYCTRSREAGVGGVPAAVEAGNRCSDFARERQSIGYRSLDLAKPLQLVFITKSTVPCFQY
jgi:hypothetical protein